MITVTTGRRFPRTVTLDPNQIVKVLIEDRRDAVRADQLEVGQVLFGWGIITAIEGVRDAGRRAA